MRRGRPSSPARANAHSAQVHDLNMIVESKGQYEDHESPTLWYGELEIYKPIIAAVNGYAYRRGLFAGALMRHTDRFGERRFRLSHSPNTAR